MKMDGTMTYSFSLDLKQKQAPTQKQKQCVMMSPQMQQGIHLLQLPLPELSEMIEAEMEQNPLLEYIQEGEMEEDRGLELESEEEEQEELEEEPEKSIVIDDQDFEILQRLDEDFKDHFSQSGQEFTPRLRDDAKKESYFETLIQAEPTLFDHLMTLAHETFMDQDHLRMAEVIIGSLNDHGFLDCDLQELAELHEFDPVTLLKILKEIQKFEPIGIGAQNLQESLLIQLRYQDKEKSLAYQIVENHYEQLLHNHLPVIQKALKCKLNDINKALDKDIVKLDLYPAASFSKQAPQVLIPDIMILQEGEELKARVNEDSLPSFKINPRYLKILEQQASPKEEKEFVQHKLYSAKWLLRNLHQRSETLEKIGNALAVKQRQFFLEPEGKLKPLTMRNLAEELNLHESTIARGVANKYVQTPRGVFPLRYFFSNSYTSKEGEELSSKTVREALMEIIEKEDRLHPYSDQALSFQLKLRGIDCARRTVAKYRTENHLGNAQQRRKY